MAPLSDTDIFVCNEDLMIKTILLDLMFPHSKSDYLHKCFHPFTLVGEYVFEKLSKTVKRPKRGSKCYLKRLQRYL